VSISQPLTLFLQDGQESYARRDLLHDLPDFNLDFLFRLFFRFARSRSYMWIPDIVFLVRAVRHAPSRYKGHNLPLPLDSPVPFSSSVMISNCHRSTVSNVSLEVIASTSLVIVFCISHSRVNPRSNRASAQNCLHHPINTWQYPDSP
jgi:hypothetical protein